MKVIFLGTSGSMPTRSRGAPAVALKRKGELILFDCGEGAQQRMAAAGLSFNRPMRILISHLHGDHILGLPGLIRTMTLLQREGPLHIYGPAGLAGVIEVFNAMLGAPSFPLEVREIGEEETVYAGAEYRIEAVRADHSEGAWSFSLTEHPRPGRFHPERARALGIPQGPLWKRLQSGEEVLLDDGSRVLPGEVVDPPRPGRKIAYSGDTRPSALFAALARGADILIHEATFGEELARRAAEEGHSTAGQAAEVAAAAGAKLLVITHISSRYADAGPLLEQARRVFPNTRVAEDLMEVEVPL